MTAKLRITITVDPALVAAGNRAVAEGAADSLSAWVSSALDDKVARDARLVALAAAIAQHEEEAGAISPADIAEQTEADRRAARRGRRRTA